MSDEKSNAGNCNTGNWNTGNCNAGNCNTGNRNTGNCNTGNWNTGNCNTGNCNTGNWNAGDRNAGNRNTGNRNTGNWNAGDRNAGYFCEQTPPATFFDLPTNLTHDQAMEIVGNLEIDLPIGAEWIGSSNMSAEEKNANPTHSTIGGFLRTHTLPMIEAFPIAWSKLNTDQRAKWLALPNFDADKFLRMYGVDVRANTKTVKVRLAGGEIVSGQIVE